VWFSAQPGFAAVTMHAAGADESFKNITAGIGSILTGLVIVVGAVWAYFKFVGGRTFKRRFSLDILAQWRRLSGVDVLHDGSRSLAWLNLVRTQSAGHSLAAVSIQCRPTTKRVAAEEVNAICR
jgi:hypothetical protein